MSRSLEKRFVVRFVRSRAIRCADIGATYHHQSLGDGGTTGCLACGTVLHPMKDAIGK